MSVQQVGEPDESRNENILRPFINIRRSADLADDPTIHDGDTVGHRQRLFLVVGDIHRGYIHLALDLLDGVPHFDTEFRIQIGQRFIHQKYLRPDDDCPRKGDTLLLPAVFDSMLLKDPLMTAPKFRAADPWFVSPSYAFVMME